MLSIYLLAIFSVKDKSSSRLQKASAHVLNYLLSSIKTYALAPSDIFITLSLIIRYISPCGIYDPNKDT